jgi:hypothetical protein
MVNREIDAGRAVVDTQEGLSQVIAFVKKENWPAATSALQEARRALDRLSAALGDGMSAEPAARVKLDATEAFPREVIGDLSTCIDYLHDVGLEVSPGALNDTSAPRETIGKVEVVREVVTLVFPWLEKRVVLEGIELPPM